MKHLRTDNHRQVTSVVNNVSAQEAVADTALEKNIIPFKITPLQSTTQVSVEPFGVVVNLDIRACLETFTGRDHEVARVLRSLVAQYRLVLFRNQLDDNHDPLSAENLLLFSSWFGNGKVHSAHRVHPKADHRHVFKVSNDPEYGCFEKGGVGASGFHSDGAFLPNPYAHSIYQIIKSPPGSNTRFVDLNKCVSNLASQDMDRLTRLFSMTCMYHVTGEMHPLLHLHPVTGKAVFLIGDWYAVRETFTGKKDSLLKAGKLKDDTDVLLLNNKNEDWTTFGRVRKNLPKDVKIACAHWLSKDEMQQLQQYLQNLFETCSSQIQHHWVLGDIIVTDNLALAHKAGSENAGDSSQGIRILNRVTVMGTQSNKLAPL